MVYSPTAAYYSVRPNVQDSIRDVFRATENLPRMRNLSRKDRKALLLGIAKEHTKAQMVWYSAQKR